MKTALHTKVDKDIKDKAQVLARELGIPLSTIINAQLREFVRNGEFRVSREPRVKDEVMDELKAMTDAYKAGKMDEFDGPFSSAEEALAFLHES